MEKRLKIEGSPASRMIQLMQKHGHNRDVTIELGTVTQAMPDLAILMESDGLTLDREDLIVSQTANDAGLAVGDQVIVIGDDNTQIYFVIDKAVM